MPHLAGGWGNLNACLTDSRSDSRARNDSAALPAAGLDVEHNQEDGGNQNEHQAGNKAKIVGFHVVTADSRTVSPARHPPSTCFIGRCSGI
jgi:hypothetical protein